MARALVLTVLAGCLLHATIFIVVSAQPHSHHSRSWKLAQRRALSMQAKANRLRNESVAAHVEHRHHGGKLKVGACQCVQLERLLLVQGDFHSHVHVASSATGGPRRHITPHGWMAAFVRILTGHHRSPRQPGEDCVRRPV